MRKYEIQLPSSYSGGRPIEHEKISRAREELLAVFGSFTVPDRRTWKYDGVEYVEIVKIEIITTRVVPKKRLKDLKERLKESLQQIDILITSQGIQVI